MTWESELFDLFDDLESRAEAAFAAERDSEVAERMRAEYRSVTMASRWHACDGSDVRVQLPGAGQVLGTVLRTGKGWVLLDEGARRWLVPMAAVLGVSGLGPRSVPDEALGVVQRLGIGSPLRRLAEGGREVVVHLRDATVLRGRLGRVGADFLELADGNQQWLVSFGALAAVQSPDAGD